MKHKYHWETVYSEKGAEAVSWYQPHADMSLALIGDTGVSRDAPVIDVGGGASTLIDDLLSEGYADLSVLDLSRSALDLAQARLGTRAERVKWIEADVTTVELPENHFDVWHDRAVFHFLISAAHRSAYVANVMRALKPSGHLIMATFAEDGPTSCSGLPVMRYSPAQLHAEFGSGFELIRHEREEHVTPGGTAQRFVYCYFRRASASRVPA